MRSFTTGPVCWTLAHTLLYDYQMPQISFCAFSIIYTCSSACMLLNCAAFVHLSRLFITRGAEYLMCIPLSWIGPFNICWFAYILSKTNVKEAQLRLENAWIGDLSFHKWYEREREVPYSTCGQSVHPPGSALPSQHHPRTWCTCSVSRSFRRKCSYARHRHKVEDIGSSQVPCCIAFIYPIPAKMTSLSRIFFKNPSQGVFEA